MVSVTDVSFDVSEAQPGDAVEVFITVETGTQQGLRCTLTVTDNLGVRIDQPVIFSGGPTVERSFTFTVPNVDDWSVCAAVRDCAPLTGFSPQAEPRAGEPVADGGIRAEQQGCGELTIEPPFDSGQIAITNCGFSPSTLEPGRNINVQATVQNPNTASAEVTVIWETSVSPALSTSATTTVAGGGSQQLSSQLSITRDWWNNAGQPQSVPITRRIQDVVKASQPKARGRTRADGGCAGCGSSRRRR